MITKCRVRKFAAMGIALTAIAVAMTGCGGGSDSPAATTVSGIVADGYIGGATVCLDINGNGACGSTEPSATTNASGAYTIADLSAIPAGNSPADYAVLVQVPATATDTDLPSGTTVGQSFVMVSPAGKGEFVSPLTTLVTARVDAGESLAAAETAVKAALGITSAGLFDDFVAKAGSASSQTNEYVKSHEAAKVVAKVMKDSFAALATTNPDATTLKLVADAAETELTTQKAAGDFNVANVLPAVGAAMPGRVLDSKYDNTDSGAVTTRTVSIDFGILAKDVAGTTALLGTDICGKQLALGSQANAAGAAVAGQINDLRFFISNIRLIDHYGNAHPVVLDETSYQSKGVALLDFETSTPPATPGVLTDAATNKCLTGNATTNTVITGKVLSGPHYHGIAFTLGVPVMSPGANKVSMNHADPAATSTPAPLTSSGMAWSWQGGKKFTKIEFTPDSGLFNGAATAGATVWNLHLGSTGCAVNPATGGLIDAGYSCGAPNVVPFDLDNGNFLNTDGSSTQKVALDLITLFQTADLSQETGGAPGCMSGATDPQCAAIFSALQLDAGMPTGTASTTFSLQP